VKSFLLFFLILSAEAQVLTPTQRVHEVLNFDDDLDFKLLDKAIERQLENYRRRALTGTIRFGTLTYPKSILRDSLIELQNFSTEALECFKVSPKQVCYEDFSNKVNDTFAIYRPLPKETGPGYSNGSTKFTSYYTPDFRGSRYPTEEYKNPIYHVPLNESDRKLSRVEIDFDHKLSGKGFEFLWVKETLFDIYFMHIQGGGRVVLPDGSTTYLSYTGSNGQKFEFVSKYLMDSGLMERGKTNYFTQRAFLEEHPEHQRPTYATAPFFIYFKETSVEPHGLDDISLTEGRSLAWDNTVYKTLGVINFIKTVKTTHLDDLGKPVKIPFSRFFLAQDTGSAIRGNARCDLYWGYGEEALFVAGKLMEQGQQYFLIKKLK
jgi:membrane-bound lytic murein transglycosylase A